MQRATIADVAKKAGVNKSTVSHVINNTRFVSDETREAVLKSIAELNYHPSQIARSLTVQRTGTVGLLISDIRNPFYHEIILGAESVALANNYSLFLSNAGDDESRSARYIGSMLNHRVDGVILMSSRMSVDIVNEALSHSIPTVILDWNEFEMHGGGAIAFDFELGIRQAVEHLIGLGHRKFAHVAGDLRFWTSRIRHDLFLKCLAEQGIDPKTVRVVDKSFNIEGGRRALHELMAVDTDERPTAIFAVHDLTALGLIFEAKQLGLSVPDDFSVIGLDNISLASQVSPALTTVALPCYTIGQQAMSMLLDLIDTPGDEIRSVPTQRRMTLPTELIVRDSTASPKV